MSKAKLAEPPNLAPDRTALFLDYDGTLVNIAATPDQAIADDALRELLSRLDRKLSGAVALVSGRRIADLDGFLAPLRLTVAGLHGLELRLRNGETRECGGATEHLARAREALHALHLRTPGTFAGRQAFDGRFSLPQRTGGRARG
jgi:trehalose 6-phosphate phosphatase